MCRSSERGLSPSLRRAFSLIELLVVITIIGVLVSMLLPAVQASREAARRIGCSNNLHQIGIGLHNYHDIHNCFPPGCLEPRFKRPGGKQFAWSAFVLPCLEQLSLHAAIDFSQPFDAAANAAAAAMVIPTYLCPSTRRASPLIQGRGATDYGGLYGEAIAPLPTDGSWFADNGVMIYDRAFSVADIRDGTSHTLAISEDSNWADGQWINGLNIFDQKYAVNYIPPNPRFLENEIRSDHPGGANGAFCDGSARFLPETMSLPILKAIITRAGGEVVGDF
jgi:prepilin-type N-terminal cleavage/methylation domain-containing protein/prepilin-type processing-associated H-X9-DG protein